MELAELNERYLALSPQQRIEELYKDFSEVLYTSSFGTTAVYLIHLFNQVKPEQKIHFLDTTFHFPETLDYKKKLTELLNLNVVDLRGEEWRNQFTREDETWKKDPDLCCSVNKVEPVEKIKSQFQVWVSGLMRTQSEHRSKLRIFEKRNGIIKFYPIIDVTEDEAQDYIKQNGLPVHPLKDKGYSSIGCMHCTAKGKAREGRWVDKSKTECGLHL